MDDQNAQKRIEKVQDYLNMSVEQLEKKLTPKERRFVAELEFNGDGGMAAIRAGLLEANGKGKDHKEAEALAARLLRKDKIKAYRELKQNETYRMLGINPETIIVRLQNVYNRCMQAVPVMIWDKEAKEWVQSGEWQFDAKNALKALELMGRSQGMFVEKIISENRNMTLEDFLKSLETENGHQEP